MATPNSHLCVRPLQSGLYAQSVRSIRRTCAANLITERIESQVKYVSPTDFGLRQWISPVTSAGQHLTSAISINYATQGFVEKDMNDKQWRRLTTEERLVHGFNDTAVPKAIAGYAMGNYAIDGTRHRLLSPLCVTIAPIPLLDHREQHLNAQFQWLHYALSEVSGNILISLHDAIFLRSIGLDVTSFTKISVLKDSFTVEPPLDFTYVPSIKTTFVFEDHTLEASKIHPQTEGVLDEHEFVPVPTHSIIPTTRTVRPLAQMLAAVTRAATGVDAIQVQRVLDSVEESIPTVTEAVVEAANATTQSNETFQSLNHTIMDSVRNYVNPTITKVRDAADDISVLWTDVLARIKSVLDMLMPGASSHGTIITMLSRLEMVFTDFMGNIHKSWTFVQKLVYYFRRLLAAFNLDHILVERTAAFIKGAFEKYHTTRMCGLIPGEPDNRSSVTPGGEDEPRTVAQVAGDGYSFSTMLASIFGTTLLHTVPEPAQLKNATEIIKTFNLVAPATNNAAKFLIKCVDMFPQCVQAWVHTLFPEEWFVATVEHGDYAQLSVEVEEFLENHTMNDVLRDTAKVQQLKQYNDRLRLMLREASTRIKDATGTKWWTHACDLARKTYKFHKDVIDTQKETTKRLEPFCVYLTSPPGCGKSTLSAALARALSPPDVKPESLMYAYNSGNKHFDGYRKQNVFYVDDFFTRNEPDELEVILQAVSCSQYIVPMASLDSAVTGAKGTSFASNVVIISSNTAFPCPNTMMNVEAFNRRRHVLAEVHAPMRNGTGDVAQFREDGSHLSFDILHPTRAGKIISKDLTLEQFLEYCMIVQRNHRDNQIKRLSATSNATLLAEKIRATLPPLNELPRTLAQGRWSENSDLTGALQYFECCGNEFCTVGKKCQLRRAGWQSVCCSDPDCIAGSECCREDGDAQIKFLAELRRQQEERIAKAQFHLRPMPFDEESETDPDDVEHFIETCSFTEEPARKSNMRKCSDTIRQEFAQQLASGQSTFAQRHPWLAWLWQQRVALTAITTLLTGVVAIIYRRYRPKQPKLQKLSRTTIESATRFLESIDQYHEALNNEPDPQTRSLMQAHLDSVVAYMRDLSDAKSLDDIIEANDTGVKRHSRLARARLFQERTRSEGVPSWTVPLAIAPFVVNEVLQRTVKEDDSPNLAMRNNGAGGRPKYQVKRQGKQARANQYFQQNGPRQRTYVQGRTAAEGAIDPTAMTMLQQCYPKNIVRISRENDGTVFSMNGIMLGGQTMLAPHHFFYENGVTMLATNTLITIETIHRTKFLTKFDPRRLELMPNVDGNKDAVLYEFTQEVQAFPVILDHFVTEDDLAVLTRSDFEASLLGLSGIKIKDTIATTLRTTSIPAVWPISRHEYYMTQEKIPGEASYQLQAGWEYACHTAPGDCGSVLIAFNPHLQRKLCGMHVAGDQRFNYSELITQEDLKEAIEELNIRFTQMGFRRTTIQGLGDVTHSRFIGDEKAAAIPNGIFTPVGTVSQGEVPHIPEKTRIIPSAIHGVYPVLTQPAVLNPHDPRLEVPKGFSMVRNGVEKYTGVSIPPDVMEAQQAVEGVTDVILALRQYCAPRVLSEDEAVNGIPSDEFMGGLNFATSPGMPYVLSRPRGEIGKGYLFSGEPGFRRVSSDLLRSRLDQRLDLAKRGIRMDSLWFTTLKDERRPHAKIKTGKTRAFVIGGVDYTITMRRYFLSFVSNVMANHLNFFSAIGINPEGRDWERLYNALAANSPEGLDFDFTNFDGSLQAYFLSMACHVINKWYNDGEENAMVREVLMNELIHTEMTCMNFILYKHRGNPSGCPITSILNTIVNAMYFCYAYLKLAPPHMKAPSFFFRNVTMFNYGDDNIMTIKREVQEFFNGPNITNTLAECGLTATPASKNGTMAYILPLNELSFLKRKFARVGGRILATLDFNTITEMCNWIHSGLQLEEATFENCANALRFSFAYGPTVYAEVRTRLAAAINSLPSSRAKQLPPLPTYDYFNQFFGSAQGLPYLCCGAGTISAAQPGDARLQAQERTVAQGDVNHPVDAALGEPEIAPHAENVDGFTTTSNTAVTSAEQPGAFTHSTSAQMHIPDIHWDIARMVERPTIIATTSWSTGQGRHSYLWGSSPQPLPQAMWTASINHSAFQQFTFWRGKMTIRVQVNGTKFHNGRAILYWVPLTSAGIVRDWHAITDAARTTVPHVQIDPSTNNTVELQIDFRHPEHMLNLIEANKETPTALASLGVVVLQVQNVLRAAASSPQSVDLVISGFFTENKFAVPQPQTGCATEVQRLRALVSRLQGRTTAQMMSVVGSLAGSAAANVMRVLGRNMGPIIEKATGVLEAPQSLDKPLVSAEPPVQTIVPLGYYSNAANVTYGERMDLYPDHHDLTSADTFNTTHDEMNIPYLCGIWNLTAIRSWEVDTPVGETVFRNSICPLPGALVYPVAGGLSRGDYFSPNMLDFVSSKFTYWSGTIRYRIQLIASAYHTGKLAFTVHYGHNNTSPLPLSIPVRLSQYTVLLDLGEQREWEIEVPFYATKRMKVPHGRYEIDEGDFDLDYSIGQVALSVINQLVAPGDVSTSIDVNVWIAGGADYRLYTLGGNNSSIMRFREGFTPRSRTVAQMERQSRTVKDAERVLSGYGKEGTLVRMGESHSLVAAPSAPMPNLSRGRAITNLADCCKRFGPWWRSTNTSVRDTNYYLRRFDQMRGIFGGGESIGSIPDPNHLWGANGVISFYGGLYRGWHGSLRFKVDVQSVGEQINAADTRNPGVGAPLRLTTFHVPYAVAPTFGRDSFYTNVFGPTSDRSHDIPGGAQAVLNVLRNASLGTDVAAADPTGHIQEAFYLESAPALNVSHGMGAIQASMEFPFEPPMKFCYIPVEGEESLVSTPLYSPGTIFMALEMPNSGTSDITTSWNIEAAMGDEFRMGILIGPPVCLISHTSVFPDRYDLRETSRSIPHPSVDVNAPTCSRLCGVYDD